LLDPITYVYPKSWDYSILLDSLPKLLSKKPYLNEFMKSEEKSSEQQHKLNLEEIFWAEEEKNSE
jgi:hypothetical protein